MADEPYDRDMLTRFVTAWRALDRAMRRLCELPAGSDTAAVIRDLHDRRIISGRFAEELHQIRRARNQLTHYPSSATGEPYFTPTAAVVSRMVEVTDLLRSPIRLDAVATRAMCTRSDAPLADGLAIMRAGDFDYVPYLCDGNWCVLSREQTARLVELQPTGSFTDVSDLTVGDVAQLVGPTRPVHLPPDAALPVVAEALLRSARDGFSGGFAPVALCVVRGRAMIATLADLSIVLLDHTR